MKIQKSVSLERLVSEECARQRKHKHIQAIIVPDSNVMGYRLEGRTNKIILPSGVTIEVDERPEIFPRESINDYLKSMNLEILDYFIEPEQEYEILKAVSQLPKNEFPENIGWVDKQVLGTGMQFAQKGEKVIFLSNDGDILRTVKQLRLNLPYMRKNALAASVQRYIERQHPELLQGLDKHDKDKFMEVLEPYYKLAA